MMNIEVVKGLRKRIKDELYGFSSLTMQRREWVEKVDQTVWFWDEALNSYFDDAFMNEGENSGLINHLLEGILTQKEVELIEPFNIALEIYASKVGEVTPEDCKKILKDPEWIKITEMAKEILEKIDFDKLPGEQT